MSTHNKVRSHTILAIFKDLISIFITNLTENIQIFSGNSRYLQNPHKQRVSMHKHLQKFYNFQQIVLF